MCKKHSVQDRLKIHLKLQELGEDGKTGTQ